MANALTQQQIQELLADYAKLKEVLTQIDAKYNLNYNDVTLDFPDSLGLVKLTYTPPTDEELTAVAEQKLAAKYAEKSRLLTRSLDNAKANIALAKSRLKDNYDKTVKQLENDGNVGKRKLGNKMANNGAWFSSVRVDAESILENDYLQKKAAHTTKYQKDVAAYDKKLSDATATYQAAISALDNQKQEEIAALVLSLKDEEEKKRVNVQKYNSSVDEKEAKYKAGCERAIQYARQAEFERSLNAAKIYAELGETGMENLKLSEKTEYCKMHFGHYTLTQAQFVLEYDTFLSSHLASRYSAFVLWVNQSLKD